jgi:hypothetical protein
MFCIEETLHKNFYIIEMNFSLQAGKKSTISRVCWQIYAYRASD